MARDFCYICGANIRAVHYSENHDRDVCICCDQDRYVFLQKPEWRRALTQHPLMRCFSVDIHASELDRAFPGGLWTTFFRKIYRKKNEDTYRLSGIGHAPGAWGMLHHHLAKCVPGPPIVPRDKDSAYIGIPSMKEPHADRLIEVYPLDQCGIEEGREFYGYPIHSRCWTLAQKRLGYGIEDCLKLLVDTLTHISHWDSCPSRPLTLFSAYGYTSQSPSDPLEIADLQSVLEQKPAREPHVRFETRVDVPYDIRCVVLDLLDHRDTCNLQAAFGWHMPPVYWAQRLRRLRLLFELDGVDYDAIDWRSACLAVERLLGRTTGGLFERERVFRILDDVKERLPMLRNDTGFNQSERKCLN